MWNTNDLRDFPAVKHNVNYITFAGYMNPALSYLNHLRKRYNLDGHHYQNWHNICHVEKELLMIAQLMYVTLDMIGEKVILSNMTYKRDTYISKESM